MGVDIPELDDRGYADLLADVRKRIPVHSEAWTDHNAHDPGITILEMLAWITEATRYRLDRVTDAHLLKYLWLLGVRPRPPEPATVELQIGGSDNSPLPETLAGVTIPVGERVTADDGSNEPFAFETVEPVTLSTAELVLVETDYRGGRTNNSNANRTTGVNYLAFGPEAQQGSHFTLGFGTDPFAEAATLDISVTLYEEDLPPVSTHEIDEVVFEPSVELEWQYYVESDKEGQQWRPLEVVRDETRRLYHSGHVTLRWNESEDWSPASWSTIETAETDDEERESDTVKRPSTEGVGDLRAIRCRVATPGYEIPPRFDRIGVNTVEARHRSTRTETVLHQPDGRIETSALPGQTYVFPDAPVVSADVVLVSGAGTDERRELWTEVSNFDVSAPDDRHYVLDRANGELRFGDNRNGAVPPVERRVVAERSIHGGGTAANVPTTVVWEFALPADGDKEDDAPWRRLASLTPLGPASGGRDAESVTDAVARAQHDRETPYRTVATADYGYLAEHTPGIRVARSAARVIPGVGPDAADVVRVTVMPYSTLPEPAPSRGLLAAVERHLDSHRLLTDRIEVTAPNYVGIGVTAEARIVPGYSIAGRQEAITAALDAFLDPLDGYDGDGWPFGRPVYKSELYGVVKGVPGVDWVIDVSVHAEGRARFDGDGNVLIGESGVARPLEHDVSVRFRSEATGVDV